MPGSTKCSVLKLPLEVRNRIYKLALPPFQYSIQLFGQRITNRHGTRILTGFELSPPALLSVSDQITAEALPFFLSNNTFRLTIDSNVHFYSLLAFKFGSLEPHLHLIKRLEIGFNGTLFTLYLNDGLEEAYVLSEHPFGFCSRCAGARDRTGCWKNVRSKVRKIQTMFDDAAKFEAEGTGLSAADLNKILKHVVGLELLNVQLLIRRHLR